jgi:hypothetical protein
MAVAHPLKIKIADTQLITGRVVPPNLAELKPDDIVSEQMEKSSRRPRRIRAWSSNSFVAKPRTCCSTTSSRTCMWTRSIFSLSILAFLHEVLPVAYSLHATPNFELDVGEGASFPDRRSIQNGRRLRPVLRITTPQLNLALATLATDLSASIATAGISPHDTLRNFPVGLKRYG